LDELLRTVATSRKPADARRIRSRLAGKYHIAIVSTGLSYLTYLGALKKVGKGYKPTRLGKKIGKLLAKDHIEEANVAWGELLKRHRLLGVFKSFFSSRNSKHGTIEDFGSYLRKRAHARWDLSVTRSRISRLCELFAEKGFIEYQNNHLSLIDLKHKEPGTVNAIPSANQPTIIASAPQVNREVKRISVPIDSWPIKMEIKMEISDKTDPRILELIFAFLKEMRMNLEE